MSKVLVEREIPRGKFISELPPGKYINLIGSDGKGIYAYNKMVHMHSEQIVESIKNVMMTKKEFLVPDMARMALRNETVIPTIIRTGLGRVTIYNLVSGKVARIEDNNKIVDFTNNFYGYLHSVSEHVFNGIKKIDGKVGEGYLVIPAPYIRTLSEINQKQFAFRWKLLLGEINDKLDRFSCNLAIWEIK